MKKIAALLSVIAICISFASCGAKPENSSSEPTSSQDVSDDSVSSGKNESVTEDDDDYGQKVAFTSLSFGNCHALALDTEGRIWGWGQNQHSCLGSFDGITNEPRLLTNQSIFVFTQASVNFSVAIDKNNDLYTWGLNSSGQLGNGTTEDSEVPVKVLSGVKAAAAGYDFVAAITTDGTLYTWGCGQKHMLLKADTEDTSDILVPTPVETDIRFASVTAGSSGCIAVDVNGNRYSWGMSCLAAGYTASQIGIDTEGGPVVPYKLIAINGDTMSADEYVIAGGTTYALKDGVLYVSGGKDSRLADFSLNPSFGSFTEYRKDVNAVVPAMYGSLMIDGSGNIWGWGSEAFGICETSDTPVQITSGIQFIDAIIYDVVGSTSAYAIDGSGNLYSWSAPGEPPAEITVSI